jgi:hypothetical protein
VAPRARCQEVKLCALETQNPACNRPVCVAKRARTPTPGCRLGEDNKKSKQEKKAVKVRQAKNQLH